MLLEPGAQPFGCGPLKGFWRPNYDGGSILNLMASIICGQGGESPHVPLRGLPPESLATGGPIIWLLLDGVGASHIHDLCAAGGGRRFFGIQPWRSITTVCPATTASAVTTFATGAAPYEHGVTGWHVNLPDCGLVATILPGVTRLGQPVFCPGFKLNDYLRLPSYLDSTRRRRVLMSYGQIPWSAYSQAGTHWGMRWGYKSLLGFERRLNQALRLRPPALVYAYWPEYDSLCHEYGAAHQKARQHLDALDVLLARVVERVAGTRATLLITADHGMVDTAPHNHCDLADLPGLTTSLATAPAGDARHVFLYARPGRFKELRCRLEDELSSKAVIVEGEWLAAQGVYGPGRPHPAWPERIGDLVLLAREECAFTFTTPGRKQRFHVGNHGGLSRRELEVPLFVLSRNTL